MSASNWIDAKTACQLLGIRPQTLYAYVSRGLLRACSDPADPRRSLYDKLDVDQLAEKHRRPRARGDIAANAIRWGDPVLKTSISGVQGGDLYFGALHATECASRMSLEKVAAHHCKVADFRNPAPQSGTLPRPGDPLENGLAFLASRAADQQHALGQNRDALAVEGAALLSQTADAILGVTYAGPIHERIAAAWNLDPDATDLLRQTLVLMSDHELNPSTFAVRICASTGTSLSASLLAGLATLSGPRHGGVAQNARLTLEAVNVGGDDALVMAMVDPYLHGYGHPLYPAGDVRAAYVLEALGSDTPAVRNVERIASALTIRPNIDAALAAFAQHFGLPMNAAFIIFSVGRLAGWIAHAIEQVESGELIRPRADFTNARA